MGGGHPTPGSRALAVLIDDHGEALIPDLKQYYGIDLCQLFDETEPLSPRWALIHANNLALGSATVAEQRGGPQFRGWDEDRYMMAALINAVKTNTHAFVLAHVDPKKSHPDPPAPYPLPDNIEVRKKTHAPGTFGHQVGAMFAAAKKRKEAEGS